MCENAYLSIKNPKASRALKPALDPSRRMLASLAQLRVAMLATFGLRSWGPPLDQILDPHLSNRAVTLRYYRPQRSSGKVMFSLAYVILFMGGRGWGVICPSMHHRSHDQGGLCSGGSRVVYVQGGGLCPGGLCPGGPCSGGSLSRGSLLGRPPVR